MKLKSIVKTVVIACLTLAAFFLSPRHHWLTAGLAAIAATVFLAPKVIGLLIELVGGMVLLVMALVWAFFYTILPEWWAKLTNKRQPATRRNSGLSGQL